MSKSNKSDLVTKTDLKNALKNVATKDDLKQFVTKVEFKSEVKKLATKDELLDVKKTLWNLQDDLEEVKEKIKFLPTKDDFYASQDKLMKELSAMREENIISTDMKRQVNEHENRLEKIEDKLDIRYID